MYFFLALYISHMGRVDVTMCANCIMIYRQLVSYQILFELLSPSKSHPLKDQHKRSIMLINQPVSNAFLGLRI